MLPLVEILGPWLRNKGDVLNLWSVARRLSARADVGASTALGLDRLPREPRLQRIKWMPDREAVWRAGRSGSIAAAAVLCRNAAALGFVPRRLLRAVRVAAGTDVSLLVDCSGYGYGDVWPVERTRARAAYYRRLKQQGARVVLLPQALGPFTRPEVAAASSDVFAACDRIYARDARSLEHVHHLDGGFDVRGPVPDITHLLPGTPPAEAAAWAGRVSIVPNLRMLDQTSEDTAQQYIAFLHRVIHLVRARGLEPHLVVHEAHDAGLAREIAAAATVPVVHEDALTTKGLLGASYAVIGSRYHALVSALAQGVPAIGTSWSHKYEALFADYGCSQNLVALPQQPAAIDAIVDRVLDPSSRARLATCLARHAARQQDVVDAMWQDVEALLG